MALQSPSVYTKFTGPLIPAITRLVGVLTSFSLEPNPGLPKSKLLGGPTRESMDTRHRPSITVTNDIYGWVRGVRAMLEHKSQLVWFRWLYLLFSRLMWVNELKELPDHG